MKLSIHRQMTLTTLMALLSLTFLGCSDTKLPEPGGGASYDASVTLKAPALATLSSEGGGETPQGGGETTPAGGDAIKAGFGNIVGVVKFEGSVPSMPQVTPSKDQNVCRVYTSDRLIVNPDGGVANVFVYLDRAPKGGDKVDESTVQIFDQKDCIFLPHALVVGTKQQVKILSHDPIPHNTHTKPVKNSQFNSTIDPNDTEGRASVTYRFAERQPVEVVCDFHAWMQAWHLPLDHPYGAVTDENGQFRIDHIPSGVHKFKVWHEGAGFVESGFEIRVQADEDSTPTISYPASKYSGGRDLKTKTIRIAFSN